MNLHRKLTLMPTHPMSHRVTLKQGRPLRRRPWALVLAVSVSVSSLSMAAEIEFRANASGFEVAVAEGLEWYFLESASQGETNFNQAGAEQRCAKAGDATSPGLRLPTEAEVRALAGAGTHRHNYVFWTSTPEVGRTTMAGFFDKRYTFSNPLNMKLRLMCVRGAQPAPVSTENQVGNRGVAEGASIPSKNAPVETKVTAAAPARWEPSLTEKTYALGPVRTTNRLGEPTTTFSYTISFSAGRFEAPTEREAVEKVLDFQRRASQITNSYDLAVETISEGPIDCRILRKGTSLQAHSCYREGKLRVTTLKVSVTWTDTTGQVTVHHPNGESYRTSVYRGKVAIDEARANRKAVEESAPAATAQPARSAPLSPTPTPTPTVQAVAPETRPLLAAAGQPGSASMLEQQRLIDQLDQMDKMDLQTELERSQACITRRDFPCSEKSLAKATRYAKSARDKTAVAQAHTSLQAERELVREEEAQRQALAERERKLAQEEARVAAAAQASESEPPAMSTAEAILLFGGLMNDALKQQLAIRNAEAVRAARNAQVHAEVAAQVQRQQADFARQRAQIEADRTALHRPAPPPQTRPPAGGGSVVAQITPPVPTFGPRPQTCPPGTVPSDGTGGTPMGTPRAAICVPVRSTSNASASGTGTGSRTDTGTSAPNTVAGGPPGPMVVAGSGSPTRPVGSSPGSGPILSQADGSSNSSTTPPPVLKSVDANPYDKYPAYDSNWGDPIAPWGGIAGGGKGNTRAEACSAQMQALPEYRKRVESQSRGTRRVSQTSECVCRNYVPRFGWVDFFLCQVYVQYEIIKTSDRPTVDR